MPVRQLLASLLVAATLGCGGTVRPPAKEPIALEQIPASIIDVAVEKLPGVNFDKAWKKAGGSFEISGTTATGKVREIEINADGTVVEIN